MPKTLNSNMVRVRHEPGAPLTAKERANLAKLIENPKRDEDIDLSDAPELPDNAILKHFRPRKTSVTVRLDADVLAWLKSGGEGYQTRINDLLRQAMNASRR